MGFGGSPMLVIKFIAFAHYPPRSDTSQDGGIVVLLESRQLRALFLNTNCIDIYC
jgi:predicted phosphohydrolase